MLLEGPTDFRRLTKFLQPGTCTPIVCFGKENVVSAVQLLGDDGIPGVVGLVDADFDRLLGTLPVHEGLIVSRTHDFDLDFLLTDVLARYFIEVCDDQNVLAAGGAAATLKFALEALRPLSALRFANFRCGLQYKLDELKLDEFFDGATIDVNKMVECVSRGKFGTSVHKEKLKRLVQQFQTRNFDLVQFTSGHDVCAALGISLRARIGQRRISQTWRSEVELHIRLATDWDDLDGAGLGPALRQWEVQNQPYLILKHAPVPP